MRNRSRLATVLWVEVIPLVTSPLSRAWATLTRYPLLTVIPVTWELISFWVALGFAGARSAPSGAAGVHTVSVKFLLPSALPSGSDLIGTANRVEVDSIEVLAFLPVLIATVAGAYVMGGYLRLLGGALQGDAPTWQRFTEGAQRYGRHLVPWNLLALAITLLMGVLATSPALAFLAFAGFVLVALAYLLVPFLIVVRNVTLPEALGVAPSTLRSHLHELIPIGAASVGLSMICSFGLSATGLNTLLLASPVWAWFGTWVALAVVATLQPQEPSA